jgi:F1F0 ATPase subunit 2
MTQNEILLCGIAFFWGAGIGLFYFWGLWWTLNFLQQIACPKLWLVLSFAIRTLIALVGFWVVIRIDLPAFFFTFVGFFLMRLVLIRKLRDTGKKEKHAN